MYAKFCHSSGYEFFNHNLNIHVNNIHPNSVLHTFSGLDKAVIDSLPFFQFSSLKGSREGLECAVCISKFDDTEILRLLPKCKHAFHIDCVDKWLESHSSCPLCRCRINPDDVNRFKYSNSSRFLFREEEDHDHDHDHDRFELDVFVERESDDCNKKKKDEFLMKNDELILHKFRHRIIVSDVVFKSRWSDMRSSDFVTLNCDMLSLMSSKRFVEKRRELDGENSMQLRSLMSSGKRCMSEITDMSRFQGGKSSNLNLNSNSNGEEEVRRVWLPIARKTVQLFSGKEGKTVFDHQQNNEGSYSNV